MIGTRLESRAPSWFGLIFMLLAVAVCLALAVGTDKHIWLCASVLPLLLAAALWLGRPAPFIADITPSGLMLIDGPTIGFDQIDSVIVHWMKGDSFPVVLDCGDRQLLIPPRLNVASPKLYQFLVEAIGPREKTPPDPGLADYYRRQKAAFGAPLVWHYPGRRNFRWPRRIRREQLITAACLLSGIIFAAYGIKTNSGIGIGGVFLALFGGAGLVLATFVGPSAGPLKNTAATSLIICPAGLALAQTSLKGELRWDEIRDVKLRGGDARRNMGPAGSTRRIELQVDGAVILIRDTFEQPLPVIHERIVQLWR